MLTARVRMITVPHLLWAPYQIRWPEWQREAPLVWCADAVLDHHVACGLSRHKSLAVIGALWNVVVLTYMPRHWGRLRWRLW